MKTVVIAGNQQCELAPLTDQLPHALLPVAGKSILMHALENLHRSGSRDVTVVAPVAHGQLEDAVDTGPLLGMDIEFRSTFPDLADCDKHTLLIGLRKLPDVNWAETLESNGQPGEDPVRYACAETPVALLLPPNFVGALNTELIDSGMPGVEERSLDEDRILLTDSIRNYYDANFRVLEGKARTLRPAGRESAPGKMIGPKAKFKSTSMLARAVYLGDGCRIDRSSILQGKVIIGSNAVVGKNAQVQDSILLDNTYLGDNTHCKNAILCGNLLVRVDTGVTLRLDDPLLFGSVN